MKPIPEKIVDKTILQVTRIESARRVVHPLMYLASRPGNPKRRILLNRR
ncbi:MAG TPA: hypothetical protein PLU53_01850 [Bacteroidia bacterium]|nr:hypothetical protein [Bacteroidia bacterium]